MADGAGPHRVAARRLRVPRAPEPDGDVVRLRLACTRVTRGTGRTTTPCPRTCTAGSPTRASARSCRRARTTTRRCHVPDTDEVEDLVARPSGSGARLRPLALPGRGSDRDVLHLVARREGVTYRDEHFIRGPRSTASPSAEEARARAKLSRSSTCPSPSGRRRVRDHRGEPLLRRDQDAAVSERWKCIACASGSSWWMRVRRLVPPVPRRRTVRDGRAPEPGARWRTAL